MKVVLINAASAAEEMMQINTVLAKEWAASDYRDMPGEIELEGLRHADVDYIRSNNLYAITGRTLGVTLL
jgi:hypothetical protein